MGESPWKTIHELWLEKLGKKKPQKKTEAMQRGNDLEPVARSLFEFETGTDYPPIVLRHPKHEFMIASLDGYHQITNTICEIKCPGPKDHQTALDGKVPQKYYAQLQHQLMVSEADINYYVSYSGRAMARPIPVEPDLKYIQDLMSREIIFWNCVVEKKEPKDLLL